MTKNAYIVSYYTILHDLCLKITIFHKDLYDICMYVHVHTYVHSFTKPFEHRENNYAVLWAVNDINFTSKIISHCELQNVLNISGMNLGSEI